MKKTLAIMVLAFVLFSVSAFAVEEQVVDETPESLWCNVEYEDTCFAIGLENHPMNVGVCNGITGQKVPNLPGVFYNAHITYDGPADGCEPLTPVPEFGTIGAGLALLGSAGLYIKNKRALKIRK